WLRAEERRPVGHLQYIGHVAAGGGIENGDVLLVAMDADHRCQQVAGIDEETGARLDDDLQSEGAAEVADGLDQSRIVIARLADEMAASEVDDFDALRVRREVLREVPDELGRAFVQ